MSFVSSAISRGLFELTEQNLLLCRIRVFGVPVRRTFFSSHTCTARLPTDAAAQASRRLAPSTWLETQVKNDNRPAHFPPTTSQSLLWSPHCLHTCPLRQACDNSPHSAETYPEALVCNSHIACVFSDGPPEPIMKPITSFRGSPSI
jgi:hypothetical protein